MSSYPLVRLGEVLVSARDEVIVEPTTTYQTAGVFSFGRGLFAREPLIGADTSYGKLYRIKSEQLTFGRLNAWEGGIAVVSKEFDGMFVSQEFPVLDVDDSRLDPAFLSYLCRWSGFWDLLMERSRGLGARTGARRLRVHQERLLQVEVPIPDLDEQRRVISRLDSLSAMAERVGSRLSGSGLSDLVASLPDFVDEVIEACSPRRVPLREVADLISDVVHPGDDPRPADRFVGLQHVESHTGLGLGHEELGPMKGRKFRFAPGDVIYGYLRPYLNKVWVADCHGLCSVDQYVLRPRRDMLPTMLAYALRGRTVLDLANERTHSLQLPRLRSGLLLEVPVPVMDSRQAEDTVARLDRVRQLTVEAVALRGHQDMLQSAILPSALSEVFGGVS
ncbi:MAG: hypothetical protein JJLCMIEE_03167 [Acidimicrobiales bacterium]|nr:MAG: hypothetical protein EDR02_12385 [Actinomycetota bacterium]MBV6510048.1 hypothetical protein [Acidimicrobiales bacterium]RIK04247.1 MAG: hypothetical protein DCC48_14250 [Acidobacteriota bacterium]